MIYNTVGTQNSSQVNLDDIRNSIIKVLKSCKVRILNLYIVHNHPYIYKATPSTADCDIVNEINNEITAIERLLEFAQLKSLINLYDFSIVTDFDYWSMMQMDSN